MTNSFVFSHFHYYDDSLSNSGKNFTAATTYIQVYNNTDSSIGSTTPTCNEGAWEYITSYTVPDTETTMADSGDLYRVVVATIPANLSNSNCQFTDGISLINLRVVDCGWPLNTSLLSFNGSLQNRMVQLNWSTSREEALLQFVVERSTDGRTFEAIGSVGRLWCRAKPVCLYRLFVQWKCLLPCVYERTKYAAHLLPNAVIPDR